MEGYNIGAVAKLTGIGVHNLRMWEKRYQVLDISRTESGRRVYSQQDVERLNLLKHCVEQGHNIGSIVKLDNGALQELLREHDKADMAGEKLTRLLRLALVNCAGYHFDHRTLLNHSIELVRETAIETLLANDQPLDILLVQAAYPDENLFQQLSELKARQTPKLILLIYRIAGKNDLQRLRNMGVRTVRSPIEQVDIEDILFQFSNKLHNVPVHHPLDEFENMPVNRRFSAKQLDQLSTRDYNKECECPRHLSEIITTLEAFEQYSMECQHRNREDAALHAHVYSVTAKARAALEILLEDVLKAEKIIL